MARNGPPKYYVRKVVYTREEYQVIDSHGNQKAYVDPDMATESRGTYHKRTPSPEVMSVIEPLRILTEAEAGILGLPFEGEKPATATASDHNG